MPDRKPVVYPYIPNSAPDVKAEVLREIGVESIDEFYADIPDHLRFKGRLNFHAIALEAELIRHVDSLLNKKQVHA